MVSVSQVFKAWNEGFANNNSSGLVEPLTHDSRFVSEIRAWGKRETLN